MYNKIIDENPLYRRLKMYAVLVFFVAVVFTLPMIVVGLINSRNLNGQIVEVNGVVTNVNTDDDALLVELDGKDVYTAEPIREQMDDWSALSGQNVTLILPLSQLGGTRWILGVAQGGETLVDYSQTIANKRADNTTTLIIFGVLVGVFVLGSGAIYAWQRKTPVTVEKDLADAYCEYSAMRQPSGPLQRKMPYFTIGFIGVSLVCIVAIALAADYLTGAALIATVVVASVFCAAATVSYLLLGLVWAPKNERKFYAENYPFDFNDISHIMWSKKFKQRLQKELQQEREQYPHRYADGGNGCVCDFTENGVVLSIDEQDDLPTAEQVFAQETTTFNKPVCQLSYEQLDFEAVPHYRAKDRPFSVVIKSRLLSPVALSDGTELHNDIHLLLDVNLLATLKHFDVRVEDLDYLLANKEKLMEQNCNKKRVSH